MLAPDRRSARRIIKKIQLRFRPLKTPSLPEQPAASLNISTHGIYFATDAEVSEGLLIQVLLKMPHEIAGDGEKEWRFTGRVAHVESLDAANEKSGVGVQFLYYEPPHPSV